MLNGLKIGELAQACEVSRDALRFYERERLLLGLGERAAERRECGPVVFDLGGNGDRK